MLATSQSKQYLSVFLWYYLEGQRCEAQPLRYCF
nr:MAG TPA: hypothetical protein [Caudoviricetes sp.]